MAEPFPKLKTADLLCAGKGFVPTDGLVRMFFNKHGEDEDIEDAVGLALKCVEVMPAPELSTLLAKKVDEGGIYF